MKNIMLSLLATSLILVVSTNTSFAQQVKDSTDTKLNVESKAKLRAGAKVTLPKADSQKKINLKSKPIKVRAKTHALPAKRPVVKK